MATTAVAVRPATKTRTIVVQAKKRHHSKKFTIPVALVGGFIPPVLGVWNRRNDVNAMTGFLRAGFTGIGDDGNFNFLNFKYGLVPVATGIVIHALASKMGVNRLLARSGIPLFRI